MKEIKREKIPPLILSHQLPIGEIFSCHDPAKGINEDVGVVTVIVSPLQFFQVTIQVLRAHLVEGFDNGALEQAPDPFDRVGVNVTDNPLLLGVMTVSCRVSASPMPR